MTQITLEYREPLTRDDKELVSKTIRLRPNTGHHFAFIDPMEMMIEGMDASASNMESVQNEPAKTARELETLRETLLNVAQTQCDPWHVASEYPWIRYKLTVVDDKRGLFVAIETNLGDSERGSQNFMAKDRNKLKSIINPQKVDVALETSMRGIGQYGILKLSINWVVKTKHVPVRLVVDYGNTRTMAMIAELEQDSHNIRSIEPVTFHPCDLPSVGQYKVVKNEKRDVIDSWLVLSETQFGGLEPQFEKAAQEAKASGRNLIFPQMFVELSPAVLGGGTSARGAMQTLQRIPRDVVHQAFLSSPKRYLWDIRTGVREWCMLCRHDNRMGDNEYHLIDMKGSIDWFIYKDGKCAELATRQLPFCENENSTSNNGDQAISPPLWSTMTLVALGILEAAQKRLMSSSQENIEKIRFIEKVVITYPANWMAEELDNYKAAWKSAIAAFAASRFEWKEGKPKPEFTPTLQADLNEAIAAQIPFAYGEFKRFGSAELWLKACGRRIKNRHMLRIMNVDIGGGTTDIAAITYSESKEGEEEIDIQLNFTNSYRIAGDVLVKELIEKHALPSILDEFGLIPEYRQKICKTLEKMKDEALLSQLSRVTNSVLVPIAHRWLELASENKKEEDSNSSTERESSALNSYPIGEPATDLNNLFAKILEEVGAQGHFDSVKDEWSCGIERDDLNKAIEKTLKMLSQQVGILVACFDCDMVFVSGKVSELPPLQQMLRKFIPLRHSRIIFANQYSVGDWYPMTTEYGKISDAKSVTSVGAALHSFQKFRYVEDSQSASAMSYEWQLVELNEHVRMLFDGKTTNPVKLQEGSIIKRRLSGMETLDFEPVYKFQLRYDKTDECETLGISKGDFFDCDLKRTKKGDEIEINKVTSKTAGDVSKYFQLLVCTLPDGRFWKDSPKFRVQ